MKSFGESRLGNQTVFEKREGRREERKRQGRKCRELQVFLLGNFLIPNDVESATGS